MSEFKAQIENGEVKFILSSGQEAMVLARMAEPYAKEKARQDALSKCYTIDELSGPNGRLKRSKKTILKLINSGKLRFTQIGESKGNVITEKACREFLGDIEA